MTSCHLGSHASYTFCRHWLPCNVEPSRDQFDGSFDCDVYLYLQQSFFSLKRFKKAFIPFKSAFDAIMCFNLGIWVVKCFDGCNEFMFYTLLCCGIFFHQQKWYGFLWFPYGIAIKLLQKIITIEEVLFFWLVNCDSLRVTEILNNWSMDWKYLFCRLFSEHGRAYQQNSLYDQPPRKQI